MHGDGLVAVEFQLKHISSFSMVHKICMYLGSTVPSPLAHFKAISSFWYPNFRFGGLARPYEKTSYQMLERVPATHNDGLFGHGTEKTHSVPGLISLPGICHIYWDTPWFDEAVYENSKDLMTIWMDIFSIESETNIIRYFLPIGLFIHTYNSYAGVLCILPNHNTNTFPWIVHS